MYAVCPLIARGVHSKDWTQNKSKKLYLPSLRGEFTAHRLGNGREMTPRLYLPSLRGGTSPFFHLSSFISHHSSPLFYPPFRQISTARSGLSLPINVLFYPPFRQISTAGREVKMSCVRAVLPTFSADFHSRTRSEDELRSCCFTHLFGRFPQPDEK